MILLEEVVVSAFKAAGIKLSTTESVEEKGDYVLYSRTGGEGQDKTERELVDFDFNVYGTSRDWALRLAYESQKVCRDLDLHSQVSSVALGPIVQGPVFNKQYLYTFVITVRLYNPL